MVTTLRHKLFKKKPKKSAFTLVEKAHFTFLLAKALFKVLRVQQGKEKLRAAFIDFELLEFTELFIDIGFLIEEAQVYYNDDAQKIESNQIIKHSIEDLSHSRFDVVFGPDKIDLQYFAKSLKEAMQEIKYYNFRTCLNVHKLSILTSLVYLIPDNSSIVEVGSYKCGTTILMAKLCQVLNKKIKIYALDTFQGMPAATNPDRLDSSVYDTGMFMDNPIEEIQEKIDDQGLGEFIALVKGDVAQTLTHLELNNVSLLFLDTDQYKGTQAGLNFAKKLTNNPHIIVDDSSLKGVSQAIDEFTQDFNAYKRHNLVTNFDYLFAPK